MRQKRSKRLNRISYFINMLITLPALSAGVAIGRLESQVRFDIERVWVSTAQMISLILATIIIVWTIRRLHDLGKSGWFAFFLIPPFTIFLWAYLLIFDYDKSKENKWGQHNTTLKLFGIEARGIGRLLAIISIVLFMILLYLGLSDIHLTLTSDY